MQPVTASAADTKAKEEVILSTKYPTLTGKSNDGFSFSVETRYTGGTSPRVFNLSTSGPTEFFYSITVLGGSSDIASIKLDPVVSYPETITVKAIPNPLNLPDPGKYTFTFNVGEGDIQSSIDLTIEITARYAIQLITPDGLLSTTVTADQENSIKLTVKNTGASPLENIKLTQYLKGAPSGWEIKFDPEEIETLAAGNTKEVIMSIKPSSKTISGDYESVITAATETNTASNDLTIRITVLTQQIWGWVAIGIIVLVVAGLFAMFFLLGRR